VTVKFTWLKWIKYRRPSVFIKLKCGKVNKGQTCGFFFSHFSISLSISLCDSLQPFWGLKNMEESLLHKHEEESEEKRVTWRGFSEEMRRISVTAGPMVAVVSSQYLLLTVSTMVVGHLGELYLSSAALAISLSGVTGFSLLVSSYYHFLPVSSLLDLNII